MVKPPLAEVFRPKFGSSVQCPVAGIKGAGIRNITGVAWQGAGYQGRTSHKKQVSSDKALRLAIFRPAEPEWSKGLKTQFTSLKAKGVKVGGPRGKTQVTSLKAKGVKVGWS